MGQLGGPVDKRASLLELLAEVEPKVAEQNDRLTAQYVAVSRLAERGKDIAEALVRRASGKPLPVHKDMNRGFLLRPCRLHPRR
jgi:hypothetical protein